MISHRACRPRVWPRSARPGADIQRQYDHKQSRQSTIALLDGSLVIPDPLTGVTITSVEGAEECKDHNNPFSCEYWTETRVSIPPFFSDCLRCLGPFLRVLAITDPPRALRLDGGLWQLRRVRRRGAI